VGGIAASGFTRNDCVSTTGQLKGYAKVPASSSFSSSFTNLTTAYNCTPFAVQAMRVGTGDYEVRFLGNPETIVVASADRGLCLSPGCPVTVNTSNISPGEWRVNVLDTADNSLIDIPFTLIVP
jgi:hypothetical protein